MDVNARLDELQARRAALEKIDPAVADKLREAGKLTARQRLISFFDEGTFIEVDAFVRQRPIENGAIEYDAPAEGVITGYGAVDGRLIFAYSQDKAAVSGSVSEMHAGKICKIYDMAVKAGAPVTAMLDSGGTRLAEGIDALHGFGEMLNKAAKCSGIIPQICIVFGLCTGGEALIPAASDFVIVEENAEVYVNPPSVLKATLSKDPGNAGTAKSAFANGTAHFICTGDADCIKAAHKIIAYLPSNNMECPVADISDDDINRPTPDLNGSLTDMIKQISDKDFFLEIQSGYASKFTVGLTRFGGFTAGVIAGEILNADACRKASRFISFCDAFNLPIVSFIDIAGFELSIEDELQGGTRSIAKMLNAYSEADVAKITLVVGRAYGTAGMLGSRSLGADLVLAFPSAEISIADPLTAANILFSEQIAAADDPISERQNLIAKYRDTIASPYEAAKRGYIDDIIDPSTSRQRIISAIDMLTCKQRTGRKHSTIV